MNRPPNPLPLFPLRLALFPGNPQLLHVFEPRYRQLLADCLSGDKTFGLPLLADGAIVPEPGDIGCTARILTASQLPDGRSNILTEGVQRFALESIDPTGQPYFVGSVRVFDDDPATTEDAASAARVWAHLETYRTALGIAATAETQPIDPTRTSFRIAAQLNLDYDLSEEMLRLTSTTHRLHRLDQIITRREGETEHEQTAPPGHHRNGNGRKPSA